MMELHVEKYCENCGEFVPKLDTYCIVNDGDIYNTFISCEHAQRCAAMVKWLRKEIKDEHN